MSRNRVVITGTGAFSACGAGAETLWQAARDGTSGVSHIDFEALTDQRVFHAAHIDDDLFQAHAADFKARFQDRVTGFALIAAREAIEQAGLADAQFGEETGVIVGSGFGGADTLDVNYRAFERGEPRMDPMSVPKIMTNAAASWISMTYGARGPIYCNSTACSSASQSIGLAYLLLRSGAIKRCISGGTEACVVPGVFRAWEFLRVLSPGLCRPFSQDRNGMVLGEGAGILLLETLEAARERGAQILAEVVGYGTSSDAGDLLRPDFEGAARSMQVALRDAGLEPSDIGYVNAHGTGTVANEVSETKAMRLVFGGAFDDLAVSSTKPVHGHALGAAGALESIVTLGALKHRLAPPTANYTTQDPAIGFDPVHGDSRSFEQPYCASNSFAFGGVNASLIFGPPPAD